jgi:hypothetical protein
MVVVFAMFFGIQNGFVHALSDVIASSLNKMANIQQ